jgi:hypothetical protein
MNNDTCLNCGTQLLGAYCYHCGQRRQPRIIPVSSLISEAATDYLSLDNGLLRTLRLLITQPGRLSKEYVEGHHAPYVPPFRLYLLISALYFVIISLTHSQQFFFVSPSSDTSAEDSRRLIETMPKLMFVCLPLFALMLKAAFPKRYYVEHLVFALHFTTLAFLALSLHTVVGPTATSAITDKHFLPWGIPALILDFIAQFAIFVYLFISIRRVYGPRRAVTVLYVVGFLAAYGTVMFLLLAALFQVWDAVT